MKEHDRLNITNPTVHLKVKESVIIDEIIS